MSSSRWPILVAVFLAVAAIGFYAWRQRTPDVPAGVVEGAKPLDPQVKEPGAARPAAVAAPQAPTLPGTPGADRPSLPEVSGTITPGSTSVADQFAREVRDPAWAPATEVAIGKRLDDVPAKVTTECRQAHCQVVLAGSMASVDKTIALIEREDHLYGISRHILLGKPEPQLDGTLALKLFVIFERSDKNN
ncbi:MAG: hypothetical protein NT062_35935 [Proteobacteria bacterium]|nr:hypothetical protein [Pseudomonadota bacterium]